MTVDLEAMEWSERADAPLFTRRGVDAMRELTRLYPIRAGDIVVYKCFMGAVREVVFEIDVRRYASKLARRLACCGRKSRISNLDDLVYRVLTQPCLFRYVLVFIANATILATRLKM